VIPFLGSAGLFWVDGEGNFVYASFGNIGSRYLSPTRQHGCSSCFKDFSTSWLINRECECGLNNL
jgi:hypothetical protein